MEPEVPRIADDLLRYLEGRLAAPGLGFADPPTPVAVGTEAWVFAFSLRGAPTGFGQPMILRLLFSCDEATGLATEHAVQDAVAAQGFPAPSVIGSSPGAAIMGRPFMVMARLPGEHRPDLPDAVELQMEALAQLHGLDAGPVDQALEAHGVPRERRTGSARAEETNEHARHWGLTRLDPILAWLDGHAPAADRTAVCHGDPHLANMLFHDGKLSAVLDWGSARLNDPAMDVGSVCGYASCGSYPLSDGADPRGQAIDRILDAYGRHRPADPGRVRYFEAEFLVHVLADMTDRTIRRRAGGSVADNPLLDDAGTVERVQERLMSLTGIAVPTPEQAAG